MISCSDCGYIKTLNRQQQEIVVSDEYPMMIIAGAGSGKTRTLVSKITYLIDQENIDPYNIMALTFTNKAADEMKERIEKICPQVGNLMIGTFHSCFLKLLQREYDKIGFEKNFTIYDTSDSKTLLKHIVADLNFDPKIYEPKLLLSKISFLKSRLITPENYLTSEYYINDKTRLPAFDKVFFEYVKSCHKNNVMDFDDILLNTFILFRDNQEILKKYQDRFQYIFIDEFQDTNVLQNEIIKMLVKKNLKLCVVGDDAQSIYAFRGAVLANVLNFKSEYDGAKIFKLEQNYRSTKNIVEAANSVIEHNKNQIKKKIWTENDKGEKCYLIKSLTEAEEAKNIANIIWFEVKEQNAKYSDFAILYRTNNQATAFESELGSQRIPYKVVGNISFYQRKEIKDFLAYLRVFVNKDDAESILRTINFPKRGIGDQSIKKIVELSKKNNIRIWDLICKSTSYFDKRFSNLLQDYVNIINFGTELSESKNAYDVASALFENLKDKMFKEESEIENVKNLLYNIEEFVKNNEDNSLLSFVNKTPLVANEDNDNADSCVSLMTVHSAKGLEFKTVFIVGVEEKLFPSESAILAGEIEDERRLFYVAMTRAKEKLFISYVCNRFLYGNLIIAKKSRFLDEINPEYVDLAPIRKKNNGYYNLGKLYKSNYYDFAKGTSGFVLNSKVYHPLFAKYGKIKNVRKVQNQTIIDIQFEDEQTVSVAENVLAFFNK